MDGLTDELTEEIEELTRRVNHLEEVLETTYLEEKFRESVKGLHPSSHPSVDIRSGKYGYFARITDIDGEDVQIIIDGIELQEDMDFAVTENADGLAIEVWRGYRG